MQLPHFYVSARVARLHVSVEVPQSRAEINGIDSTGARSAAQPVDFDTAKINAGSSRR
jgi:hypothetical protein